ncbi:MAG TPA: DUF4339 domain-containing protein [Flavisolibacter sp.]|jgi:hypothetical protein|nr:DUF4339 domain-containing protein [Flavisolibacter sp.]
METRYLLLRNNKQTGPYTIDELIEKQLKPADLIWTEGQSRSWMHPYEMEEFTPTFSKSATPKTAVIPKNEKTVDSRPADCVYKETISKNVRQESNLINKEKTEVPKKVQQPLEEEPIRFVFHKRKRTVNYGQVAGTLAAFMLLFIGWQKGWLPINNSRTTTEVVPLISSESHKAKVKTKILHTDPVSKPAYSPAEENEVTAASFETAVKTNATSTEPISKPKKTSKKISKPVITVPVLKEETIAPDLIPIQDKAAKTDIPAITSSDTKIATTGIKQDEVSDKKKGFGLFRGLFHKKKKNNESKNDETEQLNN